MICKTVLLLVCWKLLLRPDSCTALPKGICFRTRRNIYASQTLKKIPSINVREGLTFSEMVESSSVFVDKTLLIKRILEINQKVIVITSPVKSGKTINLSMLKSFFEVRVRGLEKRILSQPEQSTYKFFVKGLLTGSEKTPIDPPDSPLQAYRGMNTRNPETVTSSEFYRACENQQEVLLGTYNNLPLISERRDLVFNHLAKYAVIHLDLMMSTWFGTATIYNNLKRQISKVYSKHVFLYFRIKDTITSNTTNAEQKRIASQDLQHFLQYISEYESRTSNLSIADVENSLVKLSEMLNRYIGVPVIILIDNYAAFLQYYLLERFPEGYPGMNSESMRYNRINIDIKLYRDFITKSLSNNPYLRKAVLTDTLSINNHELLTDVADCVQYNVVDNDLQKFYGFTDKDVGLLFNHFELSEVVIEKAYSFYKGYTPQSLAANTTLNNIYSVWSIVNFLKGKTISNYWVQYALSKNKIFRLPDIRAFAGILQPLIDGQDMWIRFQETDSNLRNLLLSTKYVRGIKNDLSRKAIDCSLSIFYEIGIFTSCKTNVTNSTYVCIRIPNEEVRSGIKEVLRNVRL